MVGGNGVGDVLHENGLTRLGLCHDEGTLSLADGREQVNDACAWIGGHGVAAEIELLVGEEGCEVFERDTVPHLCRVASVDEFHGAEGEILFVLAWWSHGAVYHVSGLEPVFLYLLW